VEQQVAVSGEGGQGVGVVDAQRLKGDGATLAAAAHPGGSAVASGACCAGVGMDSTPVPATDDRSMATTPERADSMTPKGASDEIKASTRLDQLVS